MNSGVNENNVLHLGVGEGLEKRNQIWVLTWNKLKLRAGHIMQMSTQRSFKLCQPTKQSFNSSSSVSLPINFTYFSQTYKNVLKKKKTNFLPFKSIISYSLNVIKSGVNPVNTLWYQIQGYPTRPSQLCCYQVFSVGAIHVSSFYPRYSKNILPIWEK